MFGSYGVAYRGISLPTSAPSGVADQEQTTDNGGLGTTAYSSGVCQSVTFGPNPSEVSGARVTLTASNGMVGLVRFAFYANSSDLPTGAPLVTSPFYAMDTPDGTPTDFYPVFSGWTPTASTKYVLVAEFFEHYDSSTVGLTLRCNTAGGYSDGMAGGRTSPVYGSQVAIGTGFSTISAYDLDFTVYSASGSEAAAASTDTALIRGGSALVEIGATYVKPPSKIPQTITRKY